MHRTIELTD